MQGMQHSTTWAAATGLPVLYLLSLPPLYMPNSHCASSDCIKEFLLETASEISLDVLVLLPPPTAAQAGLMMPVCEAALSLPGMLHKCGCYAKPGNAASNNSSGERGLVDQSTILVFANVR